RHCQPLRQFIRYGWRHVRPLRPRTSAHPTTPTLARGFKPPMKLLTYDPGSGPRAGVLDGQDVVDASALLGAAVTLRDVRALVEYGDAALERVQRGVDRVAAPRVSLSAVTLRAPILQPPTVRDYIAFEEHATGQWTREAGGARMEVWSRLPI